MKKSSNYSNIFIVNRIIMFVVSVAIILIFLPLEGKFRYEFNHGKPWMYDDLLAPFDFAIQKPAAQLEEEKANLLENLLPHFTRNETIAGKVRSEINRLIKQELRYNDSVALSLAREYLSGLVDSIYEVGIIDLHESIEGAAQDKRLIVIAGNTGYEKKRGEVFTIKSATEYLRKKLRETGKQYPLYFNIISKCLEKDIFYDEAATDREKERLLEGISTTSGLIQHGERIIARGVIVDDNQYRMLESLRLEYESSYGGRGGYLWMLIAQILLVSLIMAIFYGLLMILRRDVFNTYRKLLLLMVLMVMMIIITFIVRKFDPVMVYLVPISMTAIVARFFVDEVTALLTLLTTTLIISFWVPASFMFISMHIITGSVALIVLRNFQQRSHFFLTTLLILASYEIIYILINLLQDGSLRHIDKQMLIILSGNAALSIFSYPLIYLFERSFRLQTEISLIELANPGNKLLREFAVRAPGSFQHSLQVSNLAEEAVRVTGGNTLLIRAGALYHDIGKMINPMYFTENQSSGIKPHDELTTEESAKLILNHVIDGVELARRYKLPEDIIDFIRTHHGTRKAEYFYLKSLKEFPDEDPDKTKYSYRGPVPFSRETAVLMMADSVEAATRSIEKPDKERIDKLVDMIIDKQASEDQFINSDITFRDITIIKQTFKQMLLNIYHPRISYPRNNDSRD